MLRRRRTIAVVAVLAAGLGALVLIPGQPAAPSADANEAATQLAYAGISAPNPDLLKALDAEIAPPPPTPPKAPAPVVATVQPAALTTGAGIAAPTAAAAAPLKSDAIGGSAVNLRAGPASSSAQLVVLQPGEAVQTGETSGSWTRVTRTDGTSGWVFSSYLASSAAARPAATDAPVAAASAPRAVIKGDSGDLEDRTARVASRLPAYARPGDASQSFILEPGDRVRISEVRGDWLRVVTEEGDSAWIHR